LAQTSPGKTPASSRASVSSPKARTPTREAPSKGAQQAHSKDIRQGPSKDEQILFDSANRDREARHLRPLTWSPTLASAARIHAQKMAQQNTLSHQFPGEADLAMRVRMAGIHFTSVAENVAEAPTAAVIHQEWMNSPHHRDNLLDADLDSVGIAVVARGGQLFAVEDFSQATP
jgi:uncharacterized protein YkwD